MFGAEGRVPEKVAMEEQLNKDELYDSSDRKKGRTRVAVGRVFICGGRKRGACLLTV